MKKKVLLVVCVGSAVLQLCRGSQPSPAYAALGIEDWVSDAATHVGAPDNRIETFVRTCPDAPGQ